MKNKIQKLLTPKAFMFIGFGSIIFVVIYTLCVSFLNRIIPVGIPPIYVYIACICTSVASLVISMMLAVIRSFKRFSITPKTLAYIGTVMLGLGISFVFSMLHPTSEHPFSEDVAYLVYNTYFIVMCSFFAAAIIYKIINSIQAKQMIYSIIDKRNHSHYTYMSKVFAGLTNRQNDYNWLICDCECYPHDKATDDKFDQKYLWLSGEELTAIIEKDDFQWIWGVLCAFDKSISFDEVLKHPIPSIDYSGYYNNPVSLQHPISAIEIIPCDSSYTLILSREKGIIDDYKNIYPECQYLSQFYEKN